MKRRRQILKHKGQPEKEVKIKIGEDKNSYRRKIKIIRFQKKPKQEYFKRG